MLSSTSGVPWTAAASKAGGTNSGVFGMHSAVIITIRSTANTPKRIGKVKSLFFLEFSFIFNLFSSLFAFLLLSYTGTGLDYAHIGKVKAEQVALP